MWDRLRKFETEVKKTSVHDVIYINNKSIHAFRKIHPPHHLKNKNKFIKDKTNHAPLMDSQSKIV